MSGAPRPRCWACLYSTHCCTLGHFWWQQTPHVPTWYWPIDLSLGNILRKPNLRLVPSLPATAVRAGVQQAVFFLKLTYCWACVLWCKFQEKGLCPGSWSGFLLHTPRSSRYGVRTCFLHSCSAPCSLWPEPPLHTPRSARTSTCVPGPDLALDSVLAGNLYRTTGSVSVPTYLLDTHHSLSRLLHTRRAYSPMALPKSQSLKTGLAPLKRLPGKKPVLNMRTKKREGVLFFWETETRTPS